MRTETPSPAQLVARPAVPMHGHWWHGWLSPCVTGWWHGQLSLCVATGGTAGCPHVWPLVAQLTVPMCD